MATKSPGVYYSETDLTDYINPAASIDTTVAIIGCAVKGKIGVPTEITQYSDFKKTFGEPISGTLAGLAVRNILSSGGKVLFIRVADMSIASKSNVIIKNKSKIVNGKMTINNSNDISVSNVIGYETSKVYGGTIEDSSGNSKKIIIRTPSEGKLRKTEMLKQFNEQLSENKAFVEFSADEKVETSSVRSFRVTVNNSYYNYYFDTTAGKIETTKSNIENAIENGVLYYNKMYLLGSTFGSYVNNSKNLTTKYSLGTNKSVTFNIKLIDETRNTETITVSLTGEGDEATGYTITLPEMAEQLNKALKSECFVVCGVDKRFYTDEDFEATSFVKSLPYLKFIFKDGKKHTLLNIETSQTSRANSFIFLDLEEVHTNPGETPAEKVSRVLTDKQYVEENGGDGSGSEEVVDLKETFIFSNIESNILEVGEVAPIDVNYNYDTKSIIFSAKGSVDAEISIDPTEDANYLFEDKDITEAFENDENDNATLAYLQSENNKAIGSFIGKLEGQPALQSVDAEGNISGLQVAIENGKIVFFENNQLNYGSFDTDPAWLINTNYYSLSSLIGETTSEAITEDERCIVCSLGTPAVDANKRDTIVFTAREFGSGTKDIGVDIRSDISSLDGRVTNSIDVYVGGVRKESFENVSYDMEYVYNPKSATKETDPIGYFANIINEEPENGGSAYVKVTVIKKDTSTTVVSVPTTKEVTDNKLIYLGTALSDEASVEKNPKVAFDSYDKYDYAVGNDGVPSDTTDLFIDAMNTADSGLSNKDLYMWHILITPDNISEEVQDAAIELCEFMEDAMYIADPPQGLSRTGVVNWHNGKFGRSSAFNSNYASTYWPWCKVYDSTLKQYSWVPPSVIMSAQYCLVDKTRGPWYAPAGEQNGVLNTVIDIEEYPNKADRDAMYLEQNRVNPFLKLRNGNIICYGEKTLQRKNSTLTKIHTRRMLIALKKELRNSIRGFIFLPTMSENISTIRSIATSIVERYKMGGGISAYRVVCDSSNNTSETLQQDVLNLDIAVVPTGCMEQININFTLEKDATNL